MKKGPAPERLQGMSDSLPRFEPGPLLEASEVERVEHDGERLLPVVTQASRERIAQPAKVVLAATAAGSFEVVDEETGLEIQATLLDATSSEAEIDDGYVVYRGGFGEGRDLVHRVTASGTEDFITFEEEPAEARVVYRVHLGDGVEGLRLVANTLELIDAEGGPRLRINAPYLVDADGERHDATLSVEGCAVDTSPAAPWGRTPTHPGAEECLVTVDWGSEDVTYPAVLDPSWTTTGLMPFPFYEAHAATVLASGLVLVSGGYGADYRAALYNPQFSTWSLTGSFVNNLARYQHSSNRLPSGKVLVAGGNSSSSSNTAEIYDPATGQWTATAPLPFGNRYLHEGVTLQDGRVLLTGGAGTPNTSLTFNETPPSWNVYPMQRDRVRHTATVLNDGRVVVIGGDYAPQWVETFEPSVNQWQLVPMPSPLSFRYHQALQLPNGRVLVAGGANHNLSMLYDPILKAWSDQRPDRAARAPRSSRGPRSLFRADDALFK